MAILMNPSIHHPLNRYDNQDEDGEDAEEATGAGAGAVVDGAARLVPAPPLATTATGPPGLEPPTSAAAVDDPVALMQQLVAEAAGAYVRVCSAPTSGSCSIRGCCRDRQHAR